MDLKRPLALNREMFKQTSILTLCHHEGTYRQSVNYSKYLLRHEPPSRWSVTEQNCRMTNDLLTS